MCCVLLLGGLAFDGNFANSFGQGAGLYVSEYVTTTGAVAIADSRFANNVGGTGAVAVWLTPGFDPSMQNVSVENCTFMRNVGIVSAGGLFLNLGGGFSETTVSTVVNGCVFDSNIGGE
jgi:hypothetical protein